MSHEQKIPLRFSIVEGGRRFYVIIRVDMRLMVLGITCKHMLFIILLSNSMPIPVHS